MGGRRSLLQELDLTLPELLRLDFLVAVCGAAGGVWIALESPATAQRTAALASQLVGVAVGAVVAGVAVMAAFMDESFLRKVRLIEKKPKRYLVPFVFTAAIGVWAFVSILVVGAIPDSAPSWLRATSSGGSAFLTVWTMASLLPCLKLLLDFVALKDDAAHVPEPGPTPIRRQESG